MLVDIHCHLDYKSYDEDRDQVIENAEKVGVKIIVTAGVNPHTNRQALEFAKKYPIVKCALGLYPIDALRKEVANSEYSELPNEPFDVDKEIEWIEQQIREDKDRNIVAISEVGLDYADSTDQEKEQQKELFKKMIALANKHDLPIVIHSRKAEADALEILEQEKAKKVVLHFFCGKKRLIKEAAERGYSFSIPTNVVRAQNFQMLIGMVNINQLFTETDSPMASPFKEKRNEPAFVIESVKKIAEIKGFTVEDTTKSLFLNYQRLFQ